MNDVRLYPYVLEPKETAAHLGRRRPRRPLWQARRTQPALGESWECWDENPVANGPLAGRTLAELRAELGRALTGPIDAGAHLPGPDQDHRRPPGALGAGPPRRRLRGTGRAPAQRQDRVLVHPGLRAGCGARAGLGARHDARRVRAPGRRRYAGRDLAPRPGPSRSGVLLAGGDAARHRGRHPAVRDAAGQRPDLPHLRLEPGRRRRPAARAARRQGRRRARLPRHQPRRGAAAGLRGGRPGAHAADRRPALPGRTGGGQAPARRTSPAMAAR